MFQPDFHGPDPSARMAAMIVEGEAARHASVALAAPATGTVEDAMGESPRDHAPTGTDVDWSSSPSGANPEDPDAAVFRAFSAAFRG